MQLLRNSSWILPQGMPCCTTADMHSGWHQNQQSTQTTHVHKAAAGHRNPEWCVLLSQQAQVFLCAKHFWVTQPRVQRTKTLQTTCTNTPADSYSCNLYAFVHAKQLASKTQAT
jgi:hypothetical protein